MRNETWKHIHGLEDCLMSDLDYLIASIGIIAAIIVLVFCFVCLMDKWEKYNGQD